MVNYNPCQVATPHHKTITLQKYDLFGVAKRLTYICSRMDDDAREYIARNYAIRLNSEIAEIIGCHPSLVGKYLRIMGLTRSAEDIAYLRQRAQARWRQTCEQNNTHALRAAKLRRVYKSERLAVLSGQPQRTHMRVNVRTRQETRECYRNNAHNKNKR